jgi:mono/diheme cytochrome c family protein
VFLILGELDMKRLYGVLAAIVLLALSGGAAADEQLVIGKKIYDRAFGRGCGTCHDMADKPQLTPLIKSGALTRARVEEMVKNGKGGMPKAIDEIMKNKAVEAAGYGETQALDALFAYIASK